MSYFTEKDKRTGRICHVVSQYWPDGRPRFRRRVANETIAKALSLKIEAAVANGTWVELRRGLTEPPPKVVTVEEFSETYLDHCRVKNRAPEFKEHNMKAITKILGDVPLDEITSAHGNRFVKERSKEVENGTINRGISVLRNMLTYAISEGIISVNSLTNFPELVETKRDPRFMTLDEERRLVNALRADDDLVGIFCGILGETGLRLSDGLRLQWRAVDLRRRQLSKLTSKGNRIVHLPLSEYAVGLFSEITRIVGCPYVFVRFGEKEPMSKPRPQLKRVAKEVGLAWVGFHDFRHFRASQWVMRGVDLKTVQELLGHEDISTTMKYAHFAPRHATQIVAEAQRSEQQELAAGSEAAGNIGNK
jgi:integrase